MNKYKNSKQEKHPISVFPLKGTNSVQTKIKSFSADKNKQISKKNVHFELEGKK